ncbi:hypothetical protein MKX01_011332 [Papaver californicum]|nr:hypothetical protein MKX01_011332 [Papaver californicum]
MDIDNDEITEVSGPDKGKSGLLVYSPHTSKAQTLQANIATFFMNAKGVTMDEIELERTTQRITKIVLQALRDQHKNQHTQAMGDQQDNQHPLAMEEQQQNQDPANSPPNPDIQRPNVQRPNHDSNTVPDGVENPKDGVVHHFGERLKQRMPS